jgi:DNA-binding NtrC family response regulator
MAQESTTNINSARPILIVDDEEIVLVALRDTLLREGYSVVSSPHAVHALSVLQEQQFSVVITDQQMPMVSGLDFLTQVRQIQPDASRILITAVLNISTLIDAINKAEIFRFVVKPWSREELLGAVKSAYDRYETVSASSKLLIQTLDANQELTRQMGGLKEELTAIKRVNPSEKGRPAA